MSSQDNPEDRIRQLEQSAANYGAVELGAEQYSGGATADPTAQLPPPVYGAPPPTYGDPPAYGAPPAYGDAYNAPPFGVSYPQVQKKGAPVGFIFGIVAVFVLIVFGGIAFVVWNATSNMGSFSTEQGGETSYARPGGGSFDEPESVGPTASPPAAEPSIVPNVPGFPGVPGQDAETAPPGGQFSISGIDENRTVACNDASVSISGVNNTVTLTGSCLRVTVSGVENNVTVDNADILSASGFDNRIIYRSGHPQINNFGGSNTVERG
jgi:hypothetical protein